MQATMNYTTVNQSLSELKRAADCMAAFLSETRAVGKQIDRFDGIGGGIPKRLNQAIAEMSAHRTDITRLYQTGTQAAQEFLACENRLAGREVYEPLVASAVFSEAQAEIEVDAGPLLSVWGSLGTIGCIVGATLGVADDPQSIGKNLAKLVGTGAKTAARIIDGKPIDLWGTSTVDAIGFSENFAKELDGYIINNSYNSANTSVAAKNASNISAVAKWSGVVMGGMVNFLSNFEEYDADLSNPRMYAETIGETAVDVVLGMVVGAGVAALAGATAPVWAVGVMTTGTIMAANRVCEELTDGKDIAEFVSDTVLDTAEAAGKLVAGAAKEVGKAVRATADCVSAGWKKFKSLF